MKKSKPFSTVDYEQLQVESAQSGLVPKIMDKMWSDPRLTDAFLNNRKGWQVDLASVLSISSDDVERTIDAFGVKTLKQMISNHPAGISPAVVAGKPSRDGYGRAMNTDALYCNTGNSCGTCRGYCSKSAQPL